MTFGRSFSLLIAMTLGVSNAFGADFGSTPKQPDASQWSLTFTTYGWIPWMTGNTTIKGRDFGVALDPSDIFGHLDWSTLPA